MSTKLGLEFDEVGKRRHGSKSTLFFCDELSRLYGHEDYAISQAASYAVENWAAAGFWKQLVAGLKIIKAREIADLPLAFFTWHDKVEDQHAGHTQDELEAVFFSDWFDREKFISGGLEMLAGVAEFWTGLRPMTPDSTPILGGTKFDNLFLNTGHGTLGWTMSLCSAKFVADVISKRATDIDPEGLSMERYYA